MKDFTTGSPLERAWKYRCYRCGTFSFSRVGRADPLHFCPEKNHELVRMVLELEDESA